MATCGARSRAAFGRLRRCWRSSTTSVTDLGKAPERRRCVRVRGERSFPSGCRRPTQPRWRIGVVLADTPEACADITAAEIERLLASGDARSRPRDRRGPSDPCQGDVGILFRTRESHREFEAALERRRIRVLCLQGARILRRRRDQGRARARLVSGRPCVGSARGGDHAVAAVCRSPTRRCACSRRFCRARCERPARRLRWPNSPSQMRALVEARAATRRWLDLVDRMPPAELVDLVLAESAYAYELRGPRFLQARENLKKIRSLLRRMQNRGYATLARMAAHLDRLAVGDEANAAIDALDAVNLMTVHAVERSRVSGGLRGESVTRHRQSARSHPRGRRRSGRAAGGGDRRLSVRGRRRPPARNGRRPSDCCMWPSLGPVIACISALCSRTVACSQDGAVSPKCCRNRCID